MRVEEAQSLLKVSTLIEVEVVIGVEGSVIFSFIPLIFLLMGFLRL